MLTEQSCLMMQSPTPSQRSESVIKPPASADLGQNALLLALQIFPPSHYTIEEIVAEGDKIVVRWQPRTTSVAHPSEKPEFGRQRLATGVTVMRHANGKIVQAWENWDRRGCCEHLGLLLSQ